MASGEIKTADVKVSVEAPLAGETNEGSSSSIKLTPPTICVVCLDRISDAVVVVPCKHDQFHFVCIATWLQHNKVCPLCKAEVRAVSYEENGRLVSYHPPEARQGNNSHDSLHRSRRRPRRPLRDDSGWNLREELQEPALAFRRQVYQHRLFSLYIGNNKYSGYRKLTPDLIRGDPSIILKARKWIRRELQVFDFLNSDSPSFGRADRRATNAEYLLEYVVSIISSIDMKGSAGQAQELLQDYLGRDNARLFFHELEAWLRSPYESLKDWDSSTQYTKHSNG